MYVAAQPFLQNSLSNHLCSTGATGYIGGDALYAIAKAHPDLEITVLVRNSDKGAKVASQYPSARLVYGDLDSAELLTTEASNADIVVNSANCDHAGAAKAIIAGLAQSQKETYLIHTTGTGILAFEDVESKTYGIRREKVYDDWDGVDEVTSLPDAAAHRLVDKIVLAASKESANIHTAIVCPPCIYGPGRGPDNQRSVQIYDMAKFTLSRHKGFVIEEGANLWTEVHVQDLSEIFSALVGAAIKPEGSKATWNDKGYYFAQSDEFVFGDMGRQIAKIAYEKKLINSAETGTVTKEDADKMRPAGAFLWATNSRCRAIRAKELLGWTPKQKSMAELLPEIIDEEAKQLGLLKTHAEETATGRLLK